MTSLKRFIHQYVVARNIYNKNIRPTGLSFDEYCTYFYGIRKGNNAVKKSNFFGKTILRTNTFWFVQSCVELFLDEVYKFKASEDKPVIIDCGSNIGLSILYFKRLYPKAEITGYEADPEIYALCKENLSTYNLDDVQLINAAVWIEDGTLSFLPDGSLGGKIEANGTEHEALLIKVPSVKLSSLLERKIDFLKMDIEGAEYELIMDCKDNLKNVEHLFVEYHSKPHSEQKLDEILKLLKEAGFRIYIKEAWENMKHPFTSFQHSKQLNFDMQLNIFAARVS